MLSHQRKKIINLLKYSKLTGFLLLVISLYFFWEGYQFVDKSLIMRSKLEEVKQEKLKLEDKLSKKEAEFLFLNSERGKEEYIKSNFPVAKKQEEVILIYKASSSVAEELNLEISLIDKLFTKFKYIVDTYFNF